MYVCRVMDNVVGRDAWPLLLSLCNTGKDLSMCDYSCSRVIMNMLSDK